MWMLRLLSPAEAEKPPGQVIEPGRNKIKLKPTAALPPSNVNAKAIVEKFQSTIEAMHAATSGQLDQIHFILSCVAEANGKPPPPPNTVVLLLELEKEDLAEPNVRVSIVQLLKSFQKLVKPDDSENNFEEKVPSSLTLLLTSLLLSSSSLLLLLPSSLLARPPHQLHRPRSPSLPVPPLSPMLLTCLQPTRPQRPATSLPQCAE